MQLNIISYANESLNTQLTCMLSSAQNSIGASVKCNLI